jgi:hypothetical protein
MLIEQHEEKIKDDQGKHRSISLATTDHAWIDAHVSTFVNKICRFDQCCYFSIATIFIGHDINILFKIHIYIII